MPTLLVTQSHDGIDAQGAACGSAYDRGNQNRLARLLEVFAGIQIREKLRQRVLDAMKRRTNAERVRSMVHLLQKYGIEVGMLSSEAGHA